uniref:Uncharacterized protein n=1 Tax=Rhizophora mucronata TaxID=61149 RepID=A0A2P2NHK0_RHIMU
MPLDTPRPQHNKRPDCTCGRSKQQ